MTDKEIIIDGVDVSGCKHYNPEQYFKCNIGCCHCEENPNCDYKQLKHKEQESKKYKQALDDIEFWVREFLKRTGQVVPNEIRQILQKISEVDK